MVTFRRYLSRPLAAVAVLTMFVFAGGLAAHAQAQIAPPPRSTVPRPPSGGQDSIADELTRLLSEQCAAWNAGDLDRFMEYYWRSDELTFSSGGRTSRGWQMTYDRYDRSYRANQQMGHLEFSELEVTPLGDSAALMLGRWQLTENDQPSGGNFSLVWRKVDGKWRIIHDHTSQSQPAEDAD